MKLEITDATDLVGRWIFYRRIRGHLFSKLTRSFVQEAHPGNIVGLIGGVVFEADAYPGRPELWRTPWFEALDELEIHSIVQPVMEPMAGAPAAPPAPAN